MIMRLIDADWLLNAIEKLKVRNTSNNATIFDVLGVLDDVEKIIKAAPINEPVKHGRWIQISDYDSDDNANFMCSLCKYGDTHAKNAVVNYCWQCGARMDSDDK